MKTLLITALLAIAGTMAFAMNQAGTNNSMQPQQEQTCADTVAQPDTVTVKPAA